MQSQEIKFRVWLKEYGIMLPLASLSWTIGKNFISRIGVYDKDKVIPDSAGYYSTYEQDSVVIMPFTGLFDKDGKEIYEKDIIKFDQDFGNFQVNWKNGYFAIETVNSGPTYYNLSDCSAKDWIKVVGNCYENPELLKENK